METPVCSIPGCVKDVSTTRDLRYLCRTHYNQLYVGGWSLDEMIERWSPTCAIYTCESPSEVLDHDHYCCPRGLGRKKRCGRCNRGFVCRNCNREIGMVERSTSLLYVRVASQKIKDIQSYLSHYNELIRK